MSMCQNYKCKRTAITTIKIGRIKFKYCIRCAAMLNKQLEKEKKTYNP